MNARRLGLAALALLGGLGSWPEAQSAGDLGWWREARFGLFIHWGPVSLVGTEIGWSRGGERRGRRGRGRIPVEVYDNLYRRFNPVKFDAAEWVALARTAGMKYVVFTTKHHDGFCMFDSRLTEYKITNTPFKRDVTAALARACHEGGLRLGFYYSQPDWHHPDYRTGNHARYIRYLHGQVRELCTNYGRVDILWFDGLGGKPEDWDARNLVKMIRKLQPGILINNRLGLPGDFDTPEQRVGTFQNRRPWESCITLCRQWAWKPEDRMKSLETCVRTLVRCAGGDGNLLLNVGPMPTGAIEPRQAARLREIGEWLERFGESVRGTRGGPFKPWRGGASTHRGDTIYLHRLGTGVEADRLSLPPIPAKVVSSRILGGGTVKVEQRSTGITVTMPRSKGEAREPIVALTLDGPASGIAPVVTYRSGSAALNAAATASNVFRGQRHYGPDKAVDDDPETRWATDTGTRRAWLEVDLKSAVVLDRAAIFEAYDRVRSFTLEYLDGATWRAFHRGQRIGKSLEIRFEAVKARRIRLNVLEAEEGPTIREFHLFAAP